MPIPHIDVEIPALKNQRPALRLVSPPKIVDSRARTNPLWYPRFLAHLIDLTVVAGFSIYFTKVSALFVLSFHMKQIKATGKTAGGLFLESFAYGQMMLGLAVFSAVALMVFVALPSRTGLTPGLGALGLRLEAQDGRRPGVPALAMRLVACGFGYLTGGVMTLATLRGLEGSFLQDRLSQTRVVQQISEEESR
jgi:hypothetical protein